MRRPIIRRANDSDGPGIERLVTETGICASGLDWSSIDGWWVAEIEGTLAGCIQILMGKPLAFVGHLAVAPQYQNTLAGVGYWLWKFAKQLMAAEGVDCVMAMSAVPAILKRAKKEKSLELEGDVKVLMKRIWRSK